MELKINNEGKKILIIGRRGSGKTTLLTKIAKRGDVIIDPFNEFRYINNPGAEYQVMNVQDIAKTNTSADLFLRFITEARHFMEPNGTIYFDSADKAYNFTPTALKKGAGTGLNLAFVVQSCAYYMDLAALADIIILFESERDENVREEFFTRYSKKIILIKDFRKQANTDNEKTVNEISRLVSSQLALLPPAK